MECIDYNKLKASIVSSLEASSILGVSRRRINQLAKSGKLRQLKRDTFLLDDVLARRNEQTELRKKYYRGDIHFDEG